MRPDADTRDWVDLSLAPGLGAKPLRDLLARFGLPRNVLAASPSSLAQVVGNELAARIAARDRGNAVEQALRWLDHPDRALLTLADDAYPKQLLEISDPPALLYLRGNAAALNATALAVVGSRNPTPQGIANAEQFARVFSDAGFSIVSGLALGIDAAAHRGALAGAASTIAVLGCGADIVYPRRNQGLFEQIAARGAIVSEFPVGTPPLPENFPRRNRVISGLARGCLVVEAALASGSLITARLAAEQGREVFAIPGSIHSPLSKGCHALIKQGAKLVESAQDVLEELGIAAKLPRGANHNMSREDIPLLHHMGFDPCSIDALVERSGLTAEAVSAMLLRLELEGKVGCLPGGLYQRTS